MTTLRDAVQEFVSDWDCGGCGHFAYYAENFRKLLAQPTQTPCDIAEDGVCEVIDCCRNPTQEEQEPVAWQWLDTGHFRKKLPVDAEPGAWNPLYTHPPRREWQGLTTQEAMSLTDTVPRGTFYGCDAGIGLGIWIAAVAAAERALKEKNHG
jgi:hypothetical protein